MKEKAEALARGKIPHGEGESEHDIFIHPNEEKDDITPSRSRSNLSAPKKKGKCA
jgi:hypothetical protein